VYLKSITMKGFKSFPDRTRLEFGRGTSVIVGPNGSGKSNVTDAVLWALGEQSPMAVRGHSMQDVIFGGAPGRQAAGSAMVELVLDDSEDVLGLGPEVSIMRRLERSGEGEYRIGGAKMPADRHHRGALGYGPGQGDALRDLSGSRGGDRHLQAA
jgi:chromosome segregation protein